MAKFKSTDRVNGQKLRTLMEKYGLSGDAGADVVAELLYTQRSNVQSWFSRGIPILYFELLARKLAERK